MKVSGKFINASFVSKFDESGLELSPLIDVFRLSNKVYNQNTLFSLIINRILGKIFLFHYYFVFLSIILAYTYMYGHLKRSKTLTNSYLIHLGILELCHNFDKKLHIF